MKTPHRTMKSRTPCARVQVRLASALFAACAPFGTLTSPAQSVAPEPAPSEDVIELSPFEVRTDKDTSYGALNSNSLTRFTTELGKTPVTADIFTETFMRDVDAISINDMLQTYGAGAGMVFATPSSDSALNQPGDRPTFGDRFTAPNMGVRGLSAGLPKRDGFSAEGTNTNGTDSWDVERVEVLRGPQGLLYGAAGAGGVINTTSKTAKFNQRRTNLLFRIDRYGSRRALAFQNAGSRNVAVIAGILYSDTQQRRVNIGDTTNAYYAQFAFRLPLRTTLRINGQYSVNKRYTPTGINVQYGSTAVDPRSGRGLGYLLATGQTGETNPATGDPYPTGSIANGIINWDNYASFGGNARVNNITTGHFEKLTT